MKISFYKGCFDRQISCEDLDYNFALSSDSPTEAWVESLGGIKSVLNKLVDKISLEKGALNEFYRHHVEYEYSTIDYDKAVEESHEIVVGKIKKFINEIESTERDLRYSLIEMFKDLMEYLEVSQEDSSYDCEQCGDSNYEMEVEL